MIRPRPRRPPWAALLATALSLGAAPPPSPPPAPATPREAVLAFVAAFERGDLDAVVALFAEDATAFLPTLRSAARLAGREALRERFGLAVDEARQAHPGGPPYFRLTPRDLEVQDLGDAAVVTFHLGTPPAGTPAEAGAFSRRTFVLRRTAAGWRIVHLHASNLTWPAAAP